jgi:ATP-dependent DNA helicase RecG
MELHTTPISALRGVGPRKAQSYHKLGVDTLYDLLQLYPRGYEDWSSPFTIVTAPLDQPCCILATVLHTPNEHFVRKNMTLYRFRVSDGAHVLHVTLFNAGYTAKHLVPGQQYLFFGTVTKKGNRYEMSAPRIEQARDARIRPVYPQTAGLSSKVIEKDMRQLLADFDAAFEQEWLPQNIRRNFSLCTARFAWQNIHFPKDGEAVRIAKRRLIFEELFLFQLGLSQLRRRSRAHTGAVITTDYTEYFASLLPYTLTGAQKRAIADGVKDMQNSFPMCRLIQGDVGSGKTAVAAALAFTAVKNELQVALMAPTDILARQHFAGLSRLLGGHLRIELLTASMPAAEKRRVIAGLAEGQVDFVVGTHALLSQKVEFQNLGLVITDEQHRFGVAQRATLTNKGNHPHLLVMSATPIPRTLALLVYGDLDVSILDELPPGRKPIDTYAVDTGKRERVYRYIRKHIEQGRQAYIVCPLIEQSEQSGELTAAKEYYKTLKNGAFAGIPTALLHGQMPGKEKDAVMAAFAAGDIKILISTVVIEVGVDVPNAVLMVIENAERFGLAQLHQLRGRVGRGEHASTCILISDATGEEATKRLKTMCSTSDGFKIAEEDLKMRGPGDFFGTKQHGLPKMRIADLITDMNILRQAGDAVKEILQTDPTLCLPEHKALATAVANLFTVTGDTAN